jgi:acyl-CoA synthetase (AMP-forming)/AMP-acid ligase II
MRSLISELLARADLTPEAPCVTTYSRRTGSVTRNHQELVLATRRAAAFLHAHGFRRGDVLVLMGTHHIDLYAVWLGCLWLGVIPTILAEPSVRVDKGIYWSRLGHLFSRIEARALALAPSIKIDQQVAGIEPVFRYDEIAAGESPTPDPVVPDADEIMLLQHSSGTTGLHKGVMLSHGAVLAHADSYSKAIGLTRRDVIATWLPLYHDMGLIACMVTPLIMGTPVVWLSPFEWVVNPVLLLQAIADHRCTLAWLPNFAFNFLAQRVGPEQSGLDLSSLRQVINCSEPVRAESMELFAKHFQSGGLDSRALHTCYAMAETVFAISSSTAESPPRERRTDAKIWQTEHRSTPVASENQQAIVHLSSGRCIDGCEVKVVSESGAALAPGVAGRLLVKSAFLFKGYHHREDLNQSIFDSAGYFDTGDLGYVDEHGHIYVTGRSKDLIIVGGKNIYPQDIESLVNDLEHIRPGRVVCFGIGQGGLGTEGLIVLAESDAGQELWPDLERNIRRAVTTNLDLDLLDAKVVSREVLQKSTSGKLARGSNREWYLQGRFGTLPPALRE